MRENAYTVTAGASAEGADDRLGGSRTGIAGAILASADGEQQVGPAATNGPSALGGNHRPGAAWGQDGACHENGRGAVGLAGGSAAHLSLAAAPASYGLAGASTATLGTS